MAKTPTPTIHVHRSFPSGYIVDMEPGSGPRIGYRRMVLVHHPSLLARVLNTSAEGFVHHAVLLPSGTRAEIIAAAVAAWHAKES
jgi:hypothetical protein